MNGLGWMRRPRGAAPSLLLVVGLLLAACGLPAGAQPASGTPPAGAGQTATVTRGDLETSVSASGTVAAQADANLVVAGGGTIKQVFVKPGERVKAGAPLAGVEDRELKLRVAEAEANLLSAQAKYEEARAGATAKEIAQAEADVRAAEAKAQQTARGTTTAQDIARAEAALRAAGAKLEATRAGTTTAQDLENAAAALRAAEAKLAAAQAGTVTPPDLANAAAALRAAEAKLADVQAGARPAEIDSAVQKVTQARASRAKAESQLANAKEQARIAVEQAADAVRSAQAQYGAAKLLYDEAVRTGKDPNVASCPVTNRKCDDLTDTKLRQYKADYEAKQLALSQAEATLAARRLAYEDARKQEIAGLQTADSQILDAQAQLDQLKAGPTPEAVVQAQAAVDQARANLEKLQQPARETDLAQAQAAVDQARANLEKLQQPVKASDVMQAQAAVDQARADLDKLRRPADPNDIVQAQAGIDRAQATLAELAAGPKAPELTTALAAVKSSEVALDLARLKLDQATLLAPFDGVVAVVNGVPGQQASTAAATPLVTLVDDSALRIDVRVAESDLARLRLNQEARITFDALPERALGGRVTFIAPKAVVEQNVVSYPVTITLDRGDAVVRPGMTATVTIVTDRKTDVLLVPNRAIRTVGRDRVVEVRYKGLTFATPVQIGMTGDSVSEVLGGLQEGDTLVINSQPTNRIQPNVTGPGVRR